VQERVSLNRIKTPFGNTLSQFAKKSGGSPGEVSNSRSVFLSEWDKIFLWKQKGAERT
jgi:hypothetical protein